MDGRPENHSSEECNRDQRCYNVSNITSNSQQKNETCEETGKYNLYPRKRQSRETNLKMIQMSKWSEKDFKTAIINFYKDWKEDKCIINEQIGDHNKEQIL